MVDLRPAFRLLETIVILAPPLVFKLIVPEVLFDAGLESRTHCSAQRVAGRPCFVHEVGWWRV